MENTLNLRKFIEKPLNTECQNKPYLNERAFKIDGKEGIKEYLNLHQLPSCDYLQVKGKEIRFIEISDIKKQKENIEKQKKLNVNISKEDTENIENIENFLKSIKFKEIKRIILEELRKKAYGSLIILCKIKEKNFIKNRKYIFHIYLCQSFRVSETQILEDIKKDLQNSLKGLIDEVKIKTIK